MIAAGQPWRTPLIPQRIAQRITPDAQTDCHRWTGSHGSDGNPQTRDEAGRKIQVHRLMYERARGPVPDGLQVSRTCGNRWCVNVAHLTTRSRSQVARGGVDIESRITIDPETGCHLWSGGHTRGGYAMARAAGKASVLHRFLYEQRHGALPPGMVLDHAVCQNRGCVNVDHLEAVTPAVNNQRGRRATLTLDAVADIRRRFAAGSATSADLAAEFGVTRGAICAAIRGRTWNGGTDPATHRRKGGARKLTLTQAAHVRASLVAGTARQSELARLYGVGDSVISGIVRGTRYSAVG